MGKSNVYIPFGTDTVRRVVCSWRVLLTPCKLPTTFNVLKHDGQIKTQNCGVKTQYRPLSNLNTGSCPADDVCRATVHVTSTDVTSNLYFNFWRILH